MKPCMKNTDSEIKKAFDAWVAAKRQGDANAMLKTKADFDKFFAGLFAKKLPV